MSRTTTSTRRRVRGGGNRRRVDRLAQLRAATARVAAGLGVLARHAAVLVIVAMIAGAAYAGWRHLGQSPYFQVRYVTVTGLVEGIGPSRERVLALAGIEERMALMDVDSDVSRQGLTDDPWIRWARVETELPDRVSIDLVVRRAEAILLFDGMYLVDEYGAIFLEVGPQASFDLPVVTGIDPNAGSAPEAIVQVLAASREWARSGPGAKLSELHWDPLLGVTLHTMDGVQVRIGRRHWAKRIRGVKVLWSRVTGSEPPAAFVLADHDEDGTRLTLGPPPGLEDKRP